MIQRQKTDRTNLVHQLLVLLGRELQLAADFFFAGGSTEFLFELLDCLAQAFEIGAGVILPLVLYTISIRNSLPGLARFAALITVIGIALNRLNTALVAFNWKMYQELPHWKELVICITVYSLYIVVYRFILYRLPILYTWKKDEEAVG